MAKYSIKIGSSPHYLNTWREGWQESYKRWDEFVENIETHVFEGPLPMVGHQISLVTPTDGANNFEGTVRENAHTSWFVTNVVHQFDLVNKGEVLIWVWVSDREPEKN